MSDFQQLVAQLEDLQAYIGWTASDAQRVRALAPLVEQHFDELIVDFYREIELHEHTRRVISGGPLQIERLRATLRQWLQDLFSGEYGTDYLARHWRIGRRHVEIGLKQTYAMAAISRLRNQLTSAISANTPVHDANLVESLKSLHKLMDLDLALIEEAYDLAFVAREQAIERERGDTLFRNVVDSAGCVMVILRPDFGLIFANDFAAKTGDIEASPLVPQNFLKRYVDPQDRATFATLMERALAGEQVPAFEARIVRSHDVGVNFLWNLRPLEQYETNVVVLAVGQDLTELDEARTKSLQAERLAVIGQMSTGLAHEGRNALQRIQACMEMLEFEVTENQEALSLVRRAQLAQDELLHMFDEVRGYAAPIRLDLSPTNPREVWREAWQLLAVQRRDRDAKLVEDPEYSPETFLLDHFRMVQVFRNLMENTLAACADPVRISVLSRTVSREGHRDVELRVRDNGPGFTAEQRRRAFEPFFTTKTRGTGLGLAIAQRIVESHGGTIAISDQCLQGAEIILTFPVR